MSASRRVVLLGALGGMAAVAGCGSGQTAPPTPKPSPTPSPSPTPTPPPPSPTPTPTPAGPIAPLTGLPTADGTPLGGPAVALKVPNLKQEQPQLGLEVADIVFCQPNGDAYTRLCPVFHSAFPASAGPIRSIRPADVPLLAPIRPVFGNTGAVEWVLNYTDAHAEYLERMTYLDWRGTGAYTVDKDRLYKAGGRTQYDRAIFAHPEAMAGLAKKMTAPPEPYLPWAPDAAAASTATGKPTTEAVVPYGRAHTYDMSYTFDQASGRYLRSQPWGEHMMGDGARISADNVLIIAAKWWMDKIWKGKGTKDPVIDLVDATGTFHYLNGGRSVTGTWSKGSVAEPFRFALADGSPLAMAPGRTWIELPSPTADLRLS